MKTLFALAFATFALAGCSKSSNDTPQPTAPAASLVGTWTWVNQRTVTAPKNGGANTTSDRPIASGNTLTYTADGHAFGTIQGMVQPTITYVFSQGVLYLTAPSGSSTTRTVPELTANRLSTVATGEDTYNRYTTTDTYTR